MPCILHFTLLFASLSDSIFFKKLYIVIKYSLYLFWMQELWLDPTPAGNS